MSNQLPDTPWGLLPPRLRVLVIIGDPIPGSIDVGQTVAEALSADSACEIVLEQAEGIRNGIARLRDEVFDTVLIEHDPERLDCLDVLDAIRTGSSEQQPILVLGEEPSCRMTALCYESGADAYLCLSETSSRMLLWQIARATERHRLLDENQRLQMAHRNNLRREQDEATRLLDQQRELIRSLSETNDSAEYGLGRRSTTWHPPKDLVDHYREMLQAYVIMGAGNLHNEMLRLTSLLVTAGVEASRALELHVAVVAEMVADLGNRSARHVTNRANLLFTEVLLHLSNAYRHRLLQPSASTASLSKTSRTSTGPVDSFQDV